MAVNNGSVCKWLGVFATIATAIGTCIIALREQPIIVFNPPLSKEEVAQNSTKPPVLYSDDKASVAAQKRQLSNFELQAKVAAATAKEKLTENKTELQHLTNDNNRLQEKVDKLLLIQKSLRQENLQLRGNDRTKKLDQQRKALQREDYRSKQNQLIARHRLLTDRLGRLNHLEKNLRELQAKYKKDFDRYGNHPNLPQYRSLAIRNYRRIAPYYKHEMSRITDRKRHLLALRAKLEQWLMDSATPIELESVPPPLAVGRQPRIHPLW